MSEDLTTEVNGGISGTEEQIKAAYALNMCMVSISQIIDYDDLYSKRKTIRLSL